MPKRLPQPGTPKTVRLVVEDEELKRIELAAVACRMSVASYVRSLVVASCDHPEWGAEVTAAAERIAANPPDGRSKPGRPKKGKGK